jgi:tetratricopeptide (TPR) repeat protein
MTAKLSAAMQIAKRMYSLAQEQNDAALIIGACEALAANLYWSGDFESARQYAMRGVQSWRSGNVQTHAEDYVTPVVDCFIFWAMCEWHFGEIASSHALRDEGISIARELKDRNALALALGWAAVLSHLERDAAEADRFASELIELSTRHNFVYWLAMGTIYRAWARSAFGNAAEGISWIEQGIRDVRVTGTVLGLPAHLSRKAEALHLADRTSEALEAINEAIAIAERFEQDYCSAELHRLRGVFLAALGAEDEQIEASLREAIRIAKEQKSVSLEKRAEATYAEYRRQKASGSGGRAIRLPLW